MSDSTPAVRSRLLPAVAAVVAMLLVSAPLAGQGIRIAAVEPNPTIEVGAESQLLQVGFHVQNLTADSLRLARVELTVFGAEREIVLTDVWPREPVPGGTPGVASGETVLVTNPFPRFARSVDLTTVRFGFTWKGGGAEYYAAVAVKPVPYRTPDDEGAGGRTR